MSSRSRRRAFAEFVSGTVRLGLALLAVAPSVPAEAAILADTSRGHTGVETDAVTPGVARPLGGLAAVLADVASADVDGRTARDCMAEAPWAHLEIPPVPDEIDGSLLSRSDMQTVTTPRKPRSDICTHRLAPISWP